MQIEGIVQGVGFRPFRCEHFKIKTSQEGEEGLALISPDIGTASKVGILVDEQDIGVRQEVREVCDLLGFDPYYLANEGKLVAFVPEVKAKTLVEAMKTHPLGREAVIVGRVVDKNPGRVLIKTRIGGHMLLETLSGEQFPRIC